MADLDLSVLGSYLEKQVAEFSGLSAVEKFSVGQSNPTFLLWARVSRDGKVLSHYDTSTAGLRSFILLQFSPDGSRIYFLGTHEDGSRGVWWIPANGGNATKAVAFDDPSLHVFSLNVGEENLYLTVAEYENDIWVGDLEW